MKTKKEGLHQKWNTFLSTDLRSDAHQSQIIVGDADEDHTQIVGGYTVKLLGGIYPPIPPCFGTTGGDLKKKGLVWKATIFCDLYVSNQKYRQYT